MYQPLNCVSAEKALSVIQSNQRVFMHGSACTPLYLMRELAKQSYRLQNVELVSITVQGAIEVDKAQYKDSFHINSLFVSASVRQAVNEGRADYVPVFLSDIPDLFRTVLVPEVALIMVSPPDEHGYCSLGVSVDVARSAVANAKHIIAQINPKVPRTHGDGAIHTSRFTHCVYHEEELPQVDYSAKMGQDELTIGKYVAELIDDGSTLQMGIGTIPDAVFRSLHNHKHLGVHTEMCSDGIVELFEKDIIDNTKKRIHPYKAVIG